MAEREPLRRDGVTLVCYGMTATYSYLLYSLGSVLPYLHDELHLSYTLTSAHSSLWVVGTITVGLGYGPAVARAGRARLWPLAAACTVAGTVLLGLGHVLGLTLLSMAVIGGAGTFCQTVANAVLADRHGTARARALVEATVGASAVAVFVPVVLGGLQSTAAGWRAGLALPVVAMILLTVAMRHTPVPEQAERRKTGGPRPPVPAEVWLRCLLVAVSVSVGFFLVFYAASLLHTQTGLSTSAAASALGAFYAGELAGRIAGSGLAGRAGPVPALIAVAVAVTAVGFVALWRSDATPVAVGGLFVAGVGVANLYPLSLTLALDSAGGRTDDAAARAQLLTGFAVLVSPLALGAVADRVGVQRAFWVEPVLLCGALALLAVGAGRRRTAAPPPGADGVAPGRPPSPG